MKRISNPVTFWLQILWPVFGFAVLLYVIYELQANAANATQLVVLVAAIVLWRRFFSGDAYEVLEGNGAVFVKKGRLAVRVPYEQIERVDVMGGRISVATGDAQLKRFTFLPVNTSYLSTGPSRREALETFAGEFAARLKNLPAAK